MSVRLRPGTEQDARAVAALFGRARADMTYLPTLHSAEEDRAYFLSQLRQRQSWVATESGDIDGNDLTDNEIAGEQIVGFAIFGDGWLHHLYIDPPRQSHGIGAQLLAAVKSRSELGLELWAFQANTGARRFYERHAFVVAEETDGSANEERAPDVRYRWDAGDRRGAR